MYNHSKQGTYTNAVIKSCLVLGPRSGARLSLDQRAKICTTIAPIIAITPCNRYVTAPHIYCSY